MFLQRWGRNRPHTKGRRRTRRRQRRRRGRKRRKRRIFIIIRVLNSNIRSWLTMENCLQKFEVRLLTTWNSVRSQAISSGWGQAQQFHCTRRSLLTFSLSLSATGKLKGEKSGRQAGCLQFKKVKLMRYLVCHCINGSFIPHAKIWHMKQRNLSNKTTQVCCCWLLF